jgi:aminocarboxymuconate-semialdehyde decarboxylase
MTKSPKQYMKDFWYDSCVYTHDVLEALIQKFGAGKVVLGSDYPVGELDPIGFIRGSRKVAPRDKQRILSDNPAKLLGLSI